MSAVELNQKIDVWRVGKAKKSSQWRGRLASFGFAILIVFPLLHYFELANYYDRTSSERGRLYSLTGVLGFLTIALMLILTKFENPFKHSSVAFYFIIAMLGIAFLGSITSLQPMFSLAYSILLIAVVLSMAYLRGIFENSSQGHLAIAAWVTALIVVSLFFYHDVDFPRRVGGIQPNELAKAAIVSMVLAFLSGSKYRFLFFIFAASVTLFAASRGGVSILVIFSIIYLFQRRPLIISILTLFFAGVLGTISWIFISTFTPDIARLFLEDILALEHSSRAVVGTGFTGRTDHWMVGANLFSDGSFWRLFLGYGIGTRESVQVEDLRYVNAHQGYLNLLLDVGLLGAASFIFAVFFSIRDYFKRSFIYNDGRYAAAAGAFCVAYLIVMFLDPIYFRLGTPFSSLFIYLVVTSGIRN
ncbi:hypothetical protein [Roseinatronobacter sp. S2]|uniref:hypothetical protein n=1 Tax=Roseinatronobacter sp. S2 TaxID=3035471 RepID=UPI00240F75F5|nr:hypothetical protein [Roseinatronobacter sp. S2]WFE75342.1 hypothetical protein P8S53_02765 [Roseinatronobacter sp. S2]